MLYISTDSWTFKKDWKLNIREVNTKFNLFWLVLTVLLCFPYSIFEVPLCSKKMKNITRLWFGVLFCASLLTSVKLEETVESTDDQQPNKCDMEECQRLKNRLATVEEAVKTIVSALASQKNELFIPINKILEGNSALRSIILPASSHVTQTNKALQTSKIISFHINKIN